MVKNNNPPLIGNVNTHKSTGARKTIKKVKNESKASVHRKIMEEFQWKTGVSYEGSVPTNPSRTTNLTKISWSDKRNLQLLRHLCTHMLDYSNRNALGAVEMQAAWVESTKRIYVTANVGSAIARFQKDNINNVSFFFKQVSTRMREKYPEQNPPQKAQEDLARHNSKTLQVKSETRIFNEPGFQDLAGAMLIDGKIEYVAKGDNHTTAAQVIFITHSYSKKKNAVRHAEQIIIEHLVSRNESGKVFISGTKIPCFCCAAEFEYWSKTINISHVDMTGAIFKNTINKHFAGQDRIKVLADRIARQKLKVNLTSDVNSDSEVDEDFGDGDNDWD